MQGAFSTVVVLVCGLGVLIAILTLISGSKNWEEYGRGGLTMDRDAPPPSTGAASTIERDTEIRQLLEARNRRRERRGEPPIDIEAELQRLTAPQIDPELREEVRQLVMARNHRRLRKGQAPLDVEAEIEREISQLPAA